MDGNELMRYNELNIADQLEELAFIVGDISDDEGNFFDRDAWINARTMIALIQCKMNGESILKAVAEVNPNVTLLERVESDSVALFWEFYRTLEDDSPLQDYLKLLADTMGIEAAVLHLQESGYDI